MNNSYKKKLIEVALPLPEINDASAYDKMPGIGPHPKGIHQWWARLPLPTARAVLFASVVDDPESHPEKWPTEELQNAERERLFDIIRLLMAKKLHENPETYAKACEEMLLHCDGHLPAVFDPFAGGGSIPLEANRLGFEAHAADLNPVAVLLNKCNLELAPRWSGCPPVNPEHRSRIGGTENWRGTNGLAADVRYYGQLIQKQLQEKIGKLYPKVRLPMKYGGGEVDVIAWLWARTIHCSNPACRARTPLVRSFWLARKKSLRVYAQPHLDRSTNKVNFSIENEGEPEKETTSGKGARCLFCGASYRKVDVRDLAFKDGVEEVPFVVVADGPRGRVYLPSDTFVAPTINLPDVDQLDQPMTDDRRWFSPPLYGMPTFKSLFTPRQLTAMVAISDHIRLVSVDIRKHALLAGMLADDASAYEKTVTTFLALALDRCGDFNNSLCRWSPTNEKVMNLFGRQAIPMVWDFAEANICGKSVGAWSTCYGYVADCVATLTAGSKRLGSASQVEATAVALKTSNLMVSTDPPYYDNIGYAALSDFFYVWLRRTVGDTYPDLFSTLLVPKMAELTALSARFDGNKLEAKEHFESGFRKVFSALRSKTDPRFPLTVYYAFKQDDEEVVAAGDDDDKKSVDLTSGWETLLEALISSGFQITATWPVRASQAWRMVSMGTNALASYIVLACRPRPDDAPRISSLQFRQELKSTLPSALKHLQQGNVAPVDFAQAAIGPGMAVYSRYRSILESSGNRLTVRAALGLINQILNEVLNEQEDEFDGETRWAIAWFEQHGFDVGSFGDAELFSKAKVTSDSMLQESGLIVSGRGEVRLKRPEQLPDEWNPNQSRRTIWGMTHHLIKIYCHDKAGDEAAATLLRHFSSRADLARDLALRLFRMSEKKGLLLEAQAYNALGLGWSEIARLAQKAGPPPAPEQGKLI